MKYSFCESVTGIGPWHIRPLTAWGRKLGGGIDTGSLCGRVQPMGIFGPDGHRGGGGWDIGVEIKPDRLDGPCPKCVEEYRKIEEKG